MSRHTFGSHNWVSCPVMYVECWNHMNKSSDICAALNRMNSLSFIFGLYGPYIYSKNGRAESASPIQLCCLRL
jgi:hypothetical protein